MQVLVLVCEVRVQELNHVEDVNRERYEDHIVTKLHSVMWASTVHVVQ